jgi:hypothetical protein
MIRHNGLGFAILLLIFGFPFAGSFAARQGQLPCPRIAKDHRPALLFVDGSIAESRFCVAYRDGDTIRREPVVSAKYLDEITQLDNSVFFISTTETDRSHRNYVVDFESGTIRLLADATEIRCVRAEPARKSAMLVDFDGTGQVRLLELGFASLATEQQPIRSRLLIGDSSNPLWGFKISPDFKHVAYPHKKGGTFIERISRYELKSLDLLTREAVTLDGDVQVEIPAISSFSNGTPPFEWISDHQLLYQDMISEESPDRALGFKDGVLSFGKLDGLFVFKTVDIRTGEITEHFRKRLTMQHNGGSLQTDPLTGRLIFNQNYVLDYQKNELIDRNLPFAVLSDPAQGRIEVKSAGEVIYSGMAICMVSRRSASGRYFAYLLSFGNNSGPSELYAIFESGINPIKVAEGPYEPTRPIGWIE